MHFLPSPWKSLEMLHLVHERLQLHKAAAKDKCWDSRLHPVSEADNKDRGLACLLVSSGQSLLVSQENSNGRRLLLLTVLEVTGQ